MAPALAVQNDNLYIAWVNTNNVLTLGQVALSESGVSGLTVIATTSHTSVNHPALASNGNLYLAWRGNGNYDLTIGRSTDNGQTLGAVLQSSQTSGVSPALASLNGTVYLAWTGTGNNQLNVARLNG